VTRDTLMGAVLAWTGRLGLRVMGRSNVATLRAPVKCRVPDRENCSFG
jgi:hypothetical protein